MIRRIKQKSRYLLDGEPDTFSSPQYAHVRVSDVAASGLDYPKNSKPPSFYAVVSARREGMEPQRGLTQVKEATPGRHQWDDTFDFIMYDDTVLQVDLFQEGKIKPVGYIMQHISGIISLFSTGYSEPIERDLEKGVSISHRHAKITFTIRVLQPIRPPVEVQNSNPIQPNSNNAPPGPGTIFGNNHSSLDEKISQFKNISLRGTTDSELALKASRLEIDRQDQLQQDHQYEQYLMNSGQKNSKPQSIKTYSHYSKISDPGTARPIHTSPVTDQQKTPTLTSPSTNHFGEDYNVLEACKLNAVFLKDQDATVEHVSSTESRVWRRESSLRDGAFGQVWKEKYKDLKDITECVALTVETQDANGDMQYRAVKVCDLKRMRGSDIDYERELSALAAFSSSKYSGLFVYLHGWWVDDLSLYVAMDFHGEGDLSDSIREGIDEIGAKEITQDILHGLNVMHKEGFTHRDIKPQNILIVRKRPEARKWWVKIGDFGISKKFMEDDKTDVQTSVGTRPYCAPEILEYLPQQNGGPIYGRKVDIWSLGCVLFNIASEGRNPFNDRTLVRYCDGMEFLDFEKLSLNLSPSGKEFLSILLQPNPRDRPTAEEALQNVWYSSDSFLDQVSEILGSESFDQSSYRGKVEREDASPRDAYDTFLSSNASSSVSTQVLGVRNKDWPFPANGRSEM